jgi:hypothetical protein
MLRVVGDEAGEDRVDGRSLLDEIAREGARRMLVATRPSSSRSSRWALQVRGDLGLQTPWSSGQRQGAHPEGDGRGWNDLAERAPGERPADQTRLLEGRGRHEAYLPRCARRTDVG